MVKETQRDDQNQEFKAVARAKAAPPKGPPPPSSPMRLDAKADDTRQRLYAVAAGAAGRPPVDPPGFLEQEDTDPNRKYGFVSSASPDGAWQTQRYSYLSEPERTRKAAWLSAHPESEFPPGDPIHAPKGANFGYVVTSEGGQSPVIETYWYETERDRELILHFIRGESEGNAG